MVEIQINENSIVVANRQQVTGELPDGDVVILSMQDGMYYGLNEVGARIWGLIQQPVRISKLVEILLSEYEVDPDQCYQELLELLTELLSRGLIQAEQEVVGEP